MDELDEVNQVIFIMRDIYHVGFYINKGVQYKLKLKQFSIGDYFITFKMKSQYAYKAACQCSGYFIRRKNWYAILNDPDHQDLMDVIKVNIDRRYSIMDRLMRTIKINVLDKLKQMNKEILIRTANPRLVQVMGSAIKDKVQSAVKNQENSLNKTTLNTNRSVVTSGSQVQNELPVFDVSAEFLLKKMEAYEFCLDYFLKKVESQS